MIPTCYLNLVSSAFPGAFEVHPRCSCWNSPTANCHEWLGTHAAMAALATALTCAVGWGPWFRKLLISQVMHTSTASHSLKTLHLISAKSRCSRFHGTWIPGTNPRRVQPSAHCCKQSCKHSRSPRTKDFWKSILKWSWRLSRDWCHLYGIFDCTYLQYYLIYWYHRYEHISY